MLQTITSLSLTKDPYHQPAEFLAFRQKELQQLINKSQTIFKKLLIVSFSCHF